MAEQLARDTTTTNLTSPAAHAAHCQTASSLLVLLFGLTRSFDQQWPRLSAQLGVMDWTRSVGCAARVSVVVHTTLAAAKSPKECRCSSHFRSRSCDPTCLYRNDSEALRSRLRARYAPHLLQIYDEPVMGMSRVPHALARLEAEGLLRGHGYLVATRMDRLFSHHVDLPHVCRQNVPLGREFFIVSGDPHGTPVFHRRDWDWGFVGCTLRVMRQMADTSKRCANNWPGCSNVGARTVPPLPRGFNGMWPPQKSVTYVTEKFGTWGRYEVNTAGCSRYSTNATAVALNASLKLVDACNDLLDVNSLCKSEMCTWILRAGMCGPDPETRACTTRSRLSTLDHHGITMVRSAFN